MQITTQSARPALTAWDFYKTRGKKKTNNDSNMGEKHSYEKSEECSKQTSGELFDQYSAECNVN